MQTERQYGGSLKRMVRAFRWWVGLWRIWWDVCPACNSDAPEVDTCLICDGYDSRATWSEYPPDKNRKALWRRRWAAECSNDKLSD